MRFLLDTHVVLWLLADTRPFGARAEAAIGSGDELAFSVVSFVEIGVKASVGKLSVPDELAARVRARGVRILALSPAHGLALAELPLHHRDPFDRLIVAQAQMEGLTLVSADRQMRAYDVALLDPLS